MKRLWLVGVLVILTGCAAHPKVTPAPPEERARVARADLHYSEPARRSEEGMPVGNGRMGSLVWTTPDSLRFQINRNDVFACDSTTHSFIRSHQDYSSGCGFVDVGFGEDALERGFKQDLNCYDGVVSTRGTDVSTRVIAWHQRDIFAIEVEDRRSRPRDIDIDLRMLRFATIYERGMHNDWQRDHDGIVRTNAHTAISRMRIRNGRIVLTQEFREGDFYDSSGVAIGIVGRKAKASHVNETTVRLSADGGKGKFTILIASAATFDPKQDVGDLAIRELDAAQTKSFDTLLADNANWWHDFWSKSFVQLHSADGEADFVEQNYTYFLYVMASCSRGNWPARFGGMLWYSNGDMRAWGSQYWWANQSCYYNGLLPANRMELIEPTFALYSRMYEACALAAQQQWGSAGIWIPETTFFNGPDKLPDWLASEMRELYLLKKPWDQRSAKFIEYAQTVQSFTSRWNWISQDVEYQLGRWIAKDKGNPPFGHTSHIMASTGKIAYLYWQRYEYTLDNTFLRDRAYPMLKGVVEFYRNFPNLKKESDGKYHIHLTNSNEPAWGVTDSDEDLAALRGTIAPCVRGSEILQVDPEMRPVWREFLEHLAPQPTTGMPDAIKPENYNGPERWVKGRKPGVKVGGSLPDPNTLAAWNFDLCTVETPDAKTREIGNATFEAQLRGPVGPESRVATLSRLPIAAAALGRADAVRYLIPAQLRADDAGRNNQPGIFRNRLALREGAGATECERLGRAAEALHTALLSSVPPVPGADPIIRVFPAWPKQWDAQYKLLARGGFLVSASMKQGKIEWVKIEAPRGGEVNIRNPWPGETVLCTRGAKLFEEAMPLMSFGLNPGETVVLKRRAA